MPQQIAFSAIICELDPLHLGHKLLLDRAKEEGLPVCCVMSGNFTQRGAPAMLDKWTRTRLALENGADLVVELPLSWAMAGAERFAAGGVALAGSLGRGRLFFGSEVPDVDLLSSIAKALLSPDFSAALPEEPGLSFALRRQRAVAALLGPKAGEALNAPNANLGVEYLKAIRRQGAALEAVAVRRVGAGHDEISAYGPEDAPPESKVSREQAPLLSASELRRRSLAGESIMGLVPDSTAQAVESAQKEGRCARPELLERAVLCRLRTMSREELAVLPDLSEGLENRLYRAVRRAGSLEELYGLVKSKRYSHARVRRLVMSAFLGLRQPLPELPPYLRLLGSSERGREALRAWSPSLPVIVGRRDVERLSQEAQAVFQAEVLADDLYGLAAPVPWPSGRDFTEKLIKL